MWNELWLCKTHSDLYVIPIHFFFYAKTVVNIACIISTDRNTEKKEV